MKNTAKIFVLGLLGMTFLTGCGEDRTREEKVAAIINKIDSPFLIMNIEPKDLMDKSGVMDGVLPNTEEMVVTLFLDKEITGIDYSEDAQLIIGAGDAFMPNFYGIFKIDDAEKFKELMDKEANAELGEKDDFNYATKTDEKYVVVWNDEFAIASNIEVDLLSMLKGAGDDQAMASVDANIKLIKEAEEGEINEEYLDFIKKDADFAMYYDGKGMADYLSTMEMMTEDESMEQMIDMYEGLSYQMFMHFENGSIDMEFESDMDDELREDLSFIGQNAVDKKYLKYGASSNPIMVGSYNINFAEFFDYWKETMPQDSYEEMQDGLSEIGLTVDDAKKAMTGEMIFILDRIKTEEYTMDYGYGDPYTYRRTDPVFGLVAGVSDKGVIEKALKNLMNEEAAAEEMEITADMEMEEMLKALEEMEGYGRGPEIEVLGNGLYKMDSDGYMYLGKGIMFVSNDSAWAANVAAGKGEKVKDPKGDLGKYPFAIYGNFASLAKSGDLGDAKAIVNVFKEVHGGANLDGGQFHIILKDKSQNSLRVIMEMIADEMNKQMMSQNPELWEELEETAVEAEECEGGACEAGACEAGACEAGACEGGE